MKKEISRDRVVEQKDGFLVITSKFDDKTIPLFCPVCTRVLTSQEDITSFRELECCEFCDTFWARPNFEKWKLGWRPLIENVEKLIDEKMLDIINVST